MMLSPERERSLSVDQLKASQVNAFAKTLKAKLLAEDSAIAKIHLSLLADEIIVKDGAATMRGSYCWRRFKTEHLCRLKIDQAF